MGAPDGAWIEQQVQQREYRVPVVAQVSEKADSPQVKLILNIVELVGPGSVLAMIALGAWIMGKKFLGRWLSEEKK